MSDITLVTGATGLLGSYLCRQLIEKGQQVRAIKRTTSSLDLLGDYADKIEWIEGDVLDVYSLEEAMKGVSGVYHCAAVISFQPNEVDYMMKVNIEGTANVMNTALTSGVQKVVHVSSVAAFGEAPDGKVIDENHADPLIAKSFWYYRSKQYSEREAWRASEEGLNVAIVCPSTILGAGWWSDEPNSLFAEIYNGLKFYTTATNGFIDVRDVAACCILVMHNDTTAQKFILSSENLSFRELIWMMADSLKVKRPSIEATKFIRAFAWRWEWFISLLTGNRPIITQESASLASINFSFSNEKFRKQFSYTFMPIGKSINDTAEAYLQSSKEKREYAIFKSPFPVSG